MKETEPLVIPHDQRITWLLWQAYHTINAKFAEAVGADAMRHYWLLAPLAGRGPQTQKELAKMLRVKESAMVELVDELEGHGWVVRKAQKDRRYRLVELTDYGKMHITVLNQAYAAAQREIAGKFAPSEWQQGLRFLWHLFDTSEPE